MAINELARQAAQELSLQFVPIPPKDFQNYACITLEAGWDFLSPFATSDLGLDYPYDLHWVGKGTRMIAKVAEALNIPVE